MQLLLSLLTLLALTTTHAFAVPPTPSFRVKSPSLHALSERPTTAPAAPAAEAVHFFAETALPTSMGEFRMRAYKLPSSSPPTSGMATAYEPCVLFKAPPGVSGPGPVFANAVANVRVHSQCLTSEVFGSQRCDCKEQLEVAMKYINENGGAIIYLQQEGRGIGLANKVKAYQLQDDGFDTVDANLHLGFGEDLRDYNVVPGILEDLGIGKINLMSNNPAKRMALQALGVTVETKIPVVAANNKYNYQYLRTKVDRMAHENLDVKPPRQPLNARVTDLAGVVADDSGYCFGKESVVDCIAAIARGEIVVVVDDLDRENEGDFIMAAELATPESIAEIVRYSSGVICVAMEGKRMDELKLPAMVSLSEDPKGTAFSVSVDGAQKHGITTGIAARERAITCKLLSGEGTVATDLVRPGHIFPLRARDGGVIERDGHTEASVDLARLAGLQPAGVLCEIVSEDAREGDMARLPELIEFAKKKNMVITSIADIKAYRLEEKV